MGVTSIMFFQIRSVSLSTTGQGGFVCVCVCVREGRGGGGVWDVSKLEGRQPTGGSTGEIIAGLAVVLALVEFLMCVRVVYCECVREFVCEKEQESKS